MPTMGAHEAYIVQGPNQDSGYHVKFLNQLSIQGRNLPRRERILSNLLGCPPGTGRWWRSLASSGHAATPKYQRGIVRNHVALPGIPDSGICLYVLGPRCLTHTFLRRLAKRLNPVQGRKRTSTSPASKNPYSAPAAPSPKSFPPKKHACILKKDRRYDHRRGRFAQHTHAFWAFMAAGNRAMTFRVQFRLQLQSQRGVLADLRRDSRLGTTPDTSKHVNHTYFEDSSIKKSIYFGRLGDL